LRFAHPQTAPHTPPRTSRRCNCTISLLPTFPHEVCLKGSEFSASFERLQTAETLISRPFPAPVACSPIVSVHVGAGSGIVRQTCMAMPHASHRVLAPVHDSSGPLSWNRTSQVSHANHHASWCSMIEFRIFVFEIDVGTRGAAISMTCARGKAAGRSGKRVGPFRPRIAP
jgi:hypothetical protein